MINLISTIVCEDVLSNAAGRMTLYSIFRDLWADVYPAEVVRLHVVTTWFNTGPTPQTVMARTVVLSDSQDLLGEAIFSFSVAPNAYHTQISRFRSLIFPAPGIYRVQVQAGTDIVADLPFFLVAPKGEA